MTNDEIFDIFSVDDPTKDEIKDWQSRNENLGTEFAVTNSEEAKALAKSIGIPHTLYRTTIIARNCWNGKVVDAITAKACIIIYDDEYATLFKLYSNV